MESPSAKDLFLEALDLKEAERSAFLDERCRDDDALRRRVAGLLAAQISEGDRWVGPCGNR